MPSNHSMNASIKSIHSNQTNVTNFTTKTLFVPFCCYKTTSKITLTTLPSSILTGNIKCRAFTSNTDQHFYQNSYDQQNNHRNQQFVPRNQQLSNDNQCSHINHTKFNINQNILSIITVNKKEFYENYAQNNEIKSVTNSLQTTANSVRKTLTYRKVWKCFYFSNDSYVKCDSCDSYNSYNSCSAAKFIRKCKKFKTSRENLCVTTKNERRR